MPKRKKTKSSKAKTPEPPPLPPDSTMKIVYTIGHSSQSLASFLALLQSRHINTLVDVRRFPGSRKHPQFGQEALRQALEEESIHYEHMPDLGGRRSSLAGKKRHKHKAAPSGRNKKKVKDGDYGEDEEKDEVQESEEDSSDQDSELLNTATVDNSAWNNQSFKNYADYAATSAKFWSALQTLVDKHALKERSTCCIMCAEAVWWRCHRRIIADYLIAMKRVRVRHIISNISTDKDTDAKMTDFAIRIDKGKDKGKSSEERVVLSYPKQANRKK